MSAAAVLEQARAVGVELSATPEGNLRWRCRGGLPDKLRQALAAQKPALLELLRPATPCPTCKRPMDSRNRCWRCCDRVCEGCGRLTGTAFISFCRLCEVARERSGVPPATQEGRSAPASADENA
jgi:hypothetical protein